MTRSDPEALAKPASEPAGGDVVLRAQSCGATVEETPFGTITTFRFLDQLQAFAALSSSAAPAGEPGFAYRDENGDIAYQSAHPAPATVEMLEAVELLRSNLNTMIEQQGRFVTYGKGTSEIDYAIEETRAFLAALAPATEGRKG